MKRFSLLSVVTSFFLAACGGGGGSDDPATNNGGGQSYDPVIITEQGVRDRLETTNMSEFYPWGHTSSATRDATRDRIRHWAHDPGAATSVLIPVKMNGVIHAEEALNNIEAKLGYTLFDRTSIAATPDDDVTYGLIFRQGTALGPSGEPSANNCGHVGNRDGGTTYELDWYKSDGTIDTVLTVNIGSSHPDADQNCIVDVGLVVHETMHALGMGVHFDGFGNCGGCGYYDHQNDQAYNVLHNIYYHVPLTHKDDLTIQTPFPGDGG